jgi:hypothetical protein
MSLHTITSDDFNIITDNRKRVLLSNAHSAISNTNAWDWLRDFEEESFVLSRDPMIEQINENMIELGYDNHTEISFEWTLRLMKTLVTHGLNTFLDSVQN